MKTILFSDTSADKSTTVFPRYETWTKVGWLFVFVQNSFVIRFKGFSARKVCFIQAGALYQYIVESVWTSSTITWYELQ